MTQRCQVTKIAHRGFWIAYDPKPIPAWCGVDWDWWHPDYDGAPDSGDRRFGHAASLEACKAAVDEWYEEHDAGAR